MQRGKVLTKRSRKDVIAGKASRATGPAKPKSHAGRISTTVKIGRLSLVGQPVRVTRIILRSRKKGR